jgi:integrase
MATIRKRGKAWHVQVRRSGQPAITKTFRLKADAEEWTRHIEIQIDRNDLPSGREILSQKSIADLLIRYRDEVVSQKKCCTYETFIIKCLLRESFASLPLTQAKPSVFAKFRDERLKSVKPSTLMRQFSVMQHAFNIAIREWEWPLPQNPVAIIRKPKIQNQRNRRLKEGELENLLKGCEQTLTPWLKPIILLAIETGMRRGELVSICWEDIDFKQETLHICETKNGFPRTIPLTRFAIEVLEALPTNEGYVLPTTGNAIRLAWVRLKKRTGVEDLRFHDLRHEAISRFFERGLSLPEVALISGHRDYRMLLRYTHLKASEVGRKLNN